MPDTTRSVEYTAQLVAAYASNNRMMAQDLPLLIQAVHQTLTSLTVTDGQIAGDPAKPAVPIKKSVQDDVIFCLEEGLPFKSLKRHLRSEHDLSPEAYRAKWNLPHDYPMVAPKYAEHRSKLAKQIGLGRKRRRK